MNAPDENSLSWRNRRVMARRTGWPAGALAECERLDREHPGWSFGWLPENRTRGWERPAGFAANRRDWSLVGADELRRDPEDGVRRRPYVFGPSVAELEQRIAAIEARHHEEEARREAAWESMARGLR
ncbi:hypothetical protein GCM10010168_85650 [Actinoplanes ianthinogenes]|uniref:Uncharacterized protein n=1 Tax=Actinoplanes ianthinogenes TaxID=122358 RepID=A0ABM7M122_9ACTN|nr:hypothetical protein [Actinoplanes ianthinogenes]BCJ45296.1 hypothetical protein Aiant_59530 [Actinoplanes ianthinogenes]GGR53620.1 hypothetical protein GCM10010168_85650 [Actinoplanes ianthinogenes]